MLGRPLVLRLTVRDVARRTCGDVEVTAATDSRVGALLDALPVPVRGRRCFVGAEELDPAARIVESPLVAGAVLSVGGPGPAFHPALGGAAGVLEVVSGADAGLTVTLRPGTYTVSRDAQATVRLSDTEASRRHARIRIARDGRASVADEGSHNGTFVDGSRITGATPLTTKSVLRIGRSTLRWVPVPPGALRTTRGPDGRLEFDREFAAAPIVPSIGIDLPTEQSVTSNTAMKVISVLTPLGVGVVSAVTSHNPAMLAMSLLGVVGPVVLGMDEGNKRTAYRNAFEAAQQEVRQRIAGQVAEERRVRRLVTPGLAEITGAATGLRSDLWPRGAASPYGLTLRVGTADQPASVDLRGRPWPGFKPPMLAGAPVTVDLRATGVLGVVGEEDPVNALVRWLLVQLATLRAPDDLRMVLITSSEGDDLAWTRWLPHLDGGTTDVPCLIGNTDETRAARVGELTALIAARLSERGAESGGHSGDEIVLLLHGALKLRNLPGMKEILRDGPKAGVHVLCVDRQSMHECRGVCEVTAESLVLTRTPDDPPVSALPDGITAARAERLARALAPMRDRSASADRLKAIPPRARLLDLLDLPTGAGPVTAEAVLAAWRRSPGPTTRIVLGADAGGPAAVDLARQGPHTMLGGATGAGKSILLQTLVSSLLLANRPDELNLVLVDFKGGSAFLPFEHCPHVTALIRSTGDSANEAFGQSAAQRTLASVRAEVRRRESLLARYGGEIDEYWRARRADPGLPPLPRLVMVFDEFARVLESSPDFLRELVNVAAKGRSLGMHLVLATQSLQGKLSPELKNNISLRISLRQNERADSVEVLGVPDAAAIPGTLHGRGMIVCTTDESRIPRVFQSGYLGDPPPSGKSAAVRARPVEWTGLGAARPAHAAGDGAAPTDQELVIAAIEKAARDAGIPAPFRPLLPELPAVLPLSELESRATGATPPTAVPFGLSDEPEAQVQPAVCLDLAGSRQLMVAGGPQSGRTTFARTLVTGLVSRFGPDRVHVYVFERRPSGLDRFEDLPHCGGVFSPAEPDRVRRLVTWLAEEVRRRGAVSSSPRPAQASGTGRRPAIVVVIDGWEHFEDRANPQFVETSLTAALREVIAVGPPVGVHVVAIGGQGMLSGRLPDLFGQRLLLPFPDEQTRRMHLGSGATSPPPLPGRAVEAGSGHHVQICRVEEEPEPLTRRSSDAASDPARLPRRFPSLPSRVTSGHLTLPQPPPSPTWIPLGVGGTDDAALGVDLFEAGPHLMLISGPPESGRTTAAVAVVRALRRIGVDALVVAPPLSPVRRLLADDPSVPVVVGTTIDDAELRAAAEAFGPGRYAVVLDDADHLTVRPTTEGFADLPTLLDEIAHPSALGRHALVMAGDITPVLLGRRRSLARLTAEVMAHGTRLLLTPAKPATAREHGFTLEADQCFTAPPGRGYLAQRRGVELLQLAAGE